MDIVIVHGAQSGNNSDAIKGPIRLGGKLKKNFTNIKFKIKTPAYEDVSDKLKESASGDISYLLGRLAFPLFPWGLVSKAYDALVDLEVYRSSGGKKAIKSIVRKSILQSNNVILIGHSMGSMVCFDVINDLMQEGEFKNKTQNKWPVRCLVSLGSILTVGKMFKPRKLITHQGIGNFDWHNIYDLRDPFIAPESMDEEDPYSNIDYEDNAEEGPNPYPNIDEHALAHSIYSRQSNKWNIRDDVIETNSSGGLSGIGYHTAYWDDENVIDSISRLIDSIDKKNKYF